MAELSESQIKRLICDWLEVNGALPCITGQKRKTFKSKYVRNGEPDIRGIWKAKPLYIEVKKPGGVVSDDQWEFISEAKKRGAIAFVAESLEDVVKMLNG